MFEKGGNNIKYQTEILFVLLILAGLFLGPAIVKQIPLAWLSNLNIAIVIFNLITGIYVLYVIVRAVLRSKRS